MEIMTPLQRVLTTLSFQEPDRVPLFLLFTMHGAKELGLSIEDYFSKPEHVAEGQIRLQKKFGHDCLNPFYYASIEAEAWGGETRFIEDGPPNCKQPIFQKRSQIESAVVPAINESGGLQKVLHTLSLLHQEAGNILPIIGVVMSPFSLPVMQMGFGPYLELIHEEPALFDLLMRKNEEFCVTWANAQIDAGATAMVYFDPVSSSTIIPKSVFLQTGYNIAKRTIARIKGAVAFHVASGRCRKILPELMETGIAGLGISCQEDLCEMKKETYGKISLVGGMNGIEMRRWNQRQVEQILKNVLQAGAPGGGFILSDNHGEIPYQVKDETLFAIAATVKKYGTYPIEQWD
jgi:uroporphyrinogen decarboxylase